MTLATATDSQVDKAIKDLGLWETLSPNAEYVSSSKASKAKSFQMDSFETTGGSTPYPDAVFSMNETPSSGSITPYEAITPPNGFDAKVQIAQFEQGRFLLPYDTQLTQAQENEKSVELITAPAVKEVQLTIQPKVTTTSSKVQIRAPVTYDPLAPASTRLRHIIAHNDSILVCPGVYDGLSARIALSLGFEGLYMTGAGTNASRLGMADLGIAHLYEMRTNAEMISNLAPDGAPVIADMDTGYGGPMVIDRSLHQYHLAGVAGFHIEDQVMQKRCGHLAGKEVVDIDTYISRIKACVAAAKRLRSDIVIIARTDALQSRGYEDCIARLRRARDEGADMGILEGFSSKAQARQAVKDLAPWPLCLNSVENGVSPLISVDEAQDMGFRVVIFSFASIAPAYEGIKRTLEWLKEYGVTGSRISPKTIFEVCGLRELMVIDEQAGGAAFKKGV
jgi:methylisocitrate lyase